MSANDVFETQVGVAAKAFADAGRKMERSRRRRRARTVAGRLVVLAAIAGVLTALALSDPVPTSTVAVVRGGDTITVMVTDLDAQADELVADLNAAGIMVETVGVSTGPSQVGRPLGFTSTSDGQPIHFDDQGREVTMPANTTRIGLFVGVPAGGAHYDRAVDAFAAGEALDGIGSRGQPADELLAVVTRDAPHLTLRWQSDTDTPTHYDSDNVRSASDGLVVVDAVGLGPTEVLVVVRPQD